MTREERGSGGRVPIWGMALQYPVQYVWDILWFYESEPEKNEPRRRENAMPFDLPFTLRVYQHVRSVPKSDSVALHMRTGVGVPQLVTSNVTSFSHLHHGVQLAPIDFFPEGLNY
jgi:hypothetical protein